MALKQMVISCSQLLLILDHNHGAKRETVKRLVDLVGSFLLLLAERIPCAADSLENHLLDSMCET